MLKKLILLAALLLAPVLADAKIFLADTNDTLEVVTASAVTTMHIHASWADITTTAITPGITNSLVTTATTTTAVGSPGASTQRQVKLLTVYNAHASSSNAVSVQVYDGTNRAVLMKYTVLAGETLQWSEDENFRVIDASGQVKAAVVADTELPAAAVLADNTANPTTTGLAAYMMCYDGSTWDRCLASPNVAHDADASAANPLLTGCYASAAAQADVSADTDAVRAWCLRNGARAIQQTYAGVLATTGAGNTGTGVQRVIEATDSQLSAGVGATGDAAATAGSTGSVNAKLRLLTTLTTDPCTSSAKTFLPINISTATTTEITPSLAGASTHYYVCSINIGPVAGAQNLALVDDDSDGCGSVTSGLAGGTTAGSGWNIAANGGLTMGNGLGSIAKTNGTNRVLCLVSSAAVQTSGVISVVAAP